jgi:tetratricopeptide (TPR) repeat protein
MTLLNSILCRADSSFARKDLPAARDFLSLAVGIAPDHPELLATLGNLHFLLREFRDACAVFSSAARQCPDNPDFLLRLALSHRELGQPAETETVLRRVLVLRPGDWSALKLLADCYRDQKRHQEAAVIYLELLGRPPTSVDVLLSLAKFFDGLGNPAAARSALEEVLRVDSANQLARENLSVLTTRRAPWRAEASSEAWRRHSNPISRGTSLANGFRRRASRAPVARRCPSARSYAKRRGSAADQPGWDRNRPCPRPDSSV